MQELLKKLPKKLPRKLPKLLLDQVPLSLKETLKLRAIGFLKIPVLFFLSPTVLELDDYRCVVKIPLSRRAKNHLGSMYFGALCAGADVAGGLIAWRYGDEITAQGGKVSLAFKDFQAEFLKRAEGDVHFTCEDGQAIHQMIERTTASGERENLPVRVIATVPSKTGKEPVATFTLTLSVKITK